MTNDEANELLKQTAIKLSEHFDAVQILATSLTPRNGTLCWQAGSGNWYARRAIAQAFVERDQAQDIAVAIRDANSEE